jgi:exopolysaccharide biosynthesis protein
MENKKRERRSLAKMLGLDLLVVAAVFGAIYLFTSAMPQAYALDQTSRVASAAAVVAEDAVANQASSGGESAAEAALVLTATPAGSVQVVSSPAATAQVAAVAQAAGSSAADLGGGKFADQFTDGEVIQTATSYKSGDISVTLSQVQQGGVTYYVEDIYLKSIENLRSAFAQDTYGRSIVDRVLNMAQANGAVAAINGDYYGAGTIGVVIRNGVLYSDRVDGDVLVLFYDGTMTVYAQTDFEAAAVMAQGAYQAWSFGPSLLSEDGQALTNFRGGIAGANPRTAIGYYEPGHYVFVVVDGRQAGYSDGMTLAQLAQLFADLGAKVAYNLDGGKTSQMTFGDALVNQPAQGGRTTSDIIYIGE